jgi:hypothetical protein
MDKFDYRYMKASGTSKKSSSMCRYRTNFWLSSLANFQKRSNPIAGFDENYYVNNTEAIEVFKIY